MQTSKKEYGTKVIKWIGKLLMFLSVFYLVRKLSVYKEDIVENFTMSTAVWIVLFSMGYSFLVYLVPFIYKTLLYWVVNKKYDYKCIAYLYCKSNIYKYLPGNVMQYIGRNQLALEDNVEHKKIFFATVLEIGVTVLSAMVVSVIFAREFMWTYIGALVSKYWYLIVLFGVICAILLALAVKKHFVKKEKIIKYFGLIFYNSMIVVFDGILFWLLMLLVDSNIGTDNLANIIGLFALSFVVGFITPGVPGGIGIREAMLCMVLDGIVNGSTLILCSIYFRIISILGDILAFFISGILYKGIRGCGKSQASNI